MLTTQALGASDTSNAGAADLSSPTGEQHCVVELTTNREQATTGHDRGCYPTIEQALDVASTPKAARGMQMFAGGYGPMATHYTGQWYSGSSITISGYCAGELYWPWGWHNNNYESLLNYCGGLIRSYDSSSCSGTRINAYGSLGSLSWMNNRTSCIRYG